jgi:hypothetical protein
MMRMVEISVRLGMGLWAHRPGLGRRDRFRTKMPPFSTEIGRKARILGSSLSSGRGDAVPGTALDALLSQIRPARKGGLHVMIVPAPGMLLTHSMRREML